MKLVTFAHDDHVSAGLLSGGKVRDLSPLIDGGIDSLDDLIRLDERTRSLVLEHVQVNDASGFPEWGLDEVQLLAPIRQPGKIVCVGLNYKDHCHETNTPIPKSPIIFSKLPSAIVGPGDTINLQQDLTSELDWEAELVVVIGSTAGPNLPGSLNSVFGYTIGNDLSARDLQREDGQWVRAKSLNTFCPLGPVVVTSDELLNPQNLGIGCKVNGTAHQDSNTSQMIFDLPYLLDWLTKGITLEPGDLIFTGTPHGTGAYQNPPVFLSHGDNVTTWISGIGELNNVVQFSPVRRVDRPIEASRAASSSEKFQQKNGNLS